MKLRGAVAAILTLGILISPVVHAATPENGISISPGRKELSMAAGTPNSGFFTITNLSDVPIDVNLSVKQFSVTDYDYDYTFDSPTDNWIKFSDQKITLQPGKNKSELYEVEVPAKAAPGGYYYTLLASSTIKSGGVVSTVQATSLLYITVKGDLIRTSVQKNNSIPWFITSPDIPYRFDVLDTGNVHFNAFFFAQVSGVFGDLPQNGRNEIVYPHKPRTITSSIDSPFWPGIYHVTYGYKVDYADITISQSSYILYLPPWSMVGIALIIMFIVWVRQFGKPSKDDE